MPNDSNAGPLPGSYWVQPGRFMAGPYPRSTTAVSELLAAGITFFLDLTEAGELPPYAPELPPDVTHQRMPIRDMRTPTVEQMTGILDAIDFALFQGRVVYVHCWAGLGRTGTVVGCYLARHGTTGQAALDELVRLRDGSTGSPQTFEQERMILRWPEDS
jgi:hypothetical protein